MKHTKQSTERPARSGRRQRARAGGPYAGPAKAPATEAMNQMTPDGDQSGRPAKGETRGVERTATPTKAAYEDGRRSEHQRDGHDGGTDQQRREPAEGSPEEGYVRLRMRLRGDVLQVVDSHFVQGPLAQHSTFHGSHVYEVSLGNRLLHAGSLPDLGVQRSFVAPDGEASGLGHHVVEREVVEFMARVPAAEVTPQTLAGIRVTLHRVKEPVHVQRLGTEPLAEQLERQVRSVAQLVGLPESALPEAITARGGRTPLV